MRSIRRRLQHLLSHRISPQRLDWRRPPWRTLPWGKIVGAALGLNAGLFGMVLGLIVGHLVDEMLWSYVIRRLLRRYARTAATPPELVALEAPLAVLAVLTREATCGARSHSAVAAETGAAAPPPGMAAALSYLADRYGTTTRHRRTLTHAAEEFHSVFTAGSRSFPEDTSLDEAFEAPLQSLLTPHERAEVAWLAGRIARGARPCARTAAEDLARRLGVTPDIVADAARTQGKLDERSCMLLGVPQDADKDQVRRAYRRLAAEFHPDATRDLEPHQRRQAEVAFIRIREAYEKLIRDL